MEKGLKQVTGCQHNALLRPPHFAPICDSKTQRTHINGAVSLSLQQANCTLKLDSLWESLDGDTSVKEP